MSAVPGLIHIVAATFREDAPRDGVAAAISRASALRSAPGVLEVVIGCSDEQLVVVTWLAGREELEEFAASREHMSFVMQGLAPVIRGMWSAAVETDTSPPSTAPSALWAFAVPEREGVYEWQVRELLDEVDALPGTAATGQTVEERERFRAGGVVAPPVADGDFQAQLAAMRRRWLEVVGAIEEALVPVLPE
jgi:hypothetical protein